MSRVAPKSLAYLSTILFVAPLLGALVPTASAGYSGKTVLTDPAGDSAVAGAGDIIRLGAYGDPTTQAFFALTLNTPAQPPAPGSTIFYDVNFTTPDGVDYIASVGYGSSGFVNPGVFQKQSGLGFNTVASWNGNELLIEWDNTMLINAVGSGQSLTNVNAATEDGLLGSGNPADTYYDGTVSSTYMIGDQGLRVPSAPQGLVATAASGSVTLAWSAPADTGNSPISSYQIWEGVSSGGESLLTTVPNTTFTASGLTNGQTYFFFVKAVNGVGVGAASGEASALPHVSGVPGMPTGVSLTAGNGRLTLAWSPPTDDGGSAITGYDIYRGTSAGGESLLATTTALTLVDAGLSNGVTYYYKLTAKNANGEGPASAELSGSPIAPPPPVTWTTTQPGLIGTGLTNTNNAGEPSLGYDAKTNTFLYQAYTSTYTLRFDDNTSPPAPAWADTAPNQENTENNDPILFTDRALGRTFAGGLHTTCSTLSSTDDDGKTWGVVGNTCTGQAIDHETIGGGPYVGAPPTGPTSWPHIYYYCAQEGNINCVNSTDGGITWSTPVTASGVCSSLFGHVKVSADGTAYIPDSNCGSQQGVVISKDNGQSWTGIGIPGTTQPGRAFDPSVATTPHDWVYFGFMDADKHPKVTLSKDHGATWATPVDVGQLVSPPITASVFQSVVAGDDERAAMAFLGTTSTASGPFTAGFNGHWDLYVAVTYDGGASWSVTKASPDPVQRGWICASGIGCPTTGDTGRNLLDFMDATMDDHGRVAVGYADGCHSTACIGQATEDNTNSRDAYTTVTRQLTGKTLLSKFDVATRVPDAPLVTPVPNDNKIVLTWDAPYDGNSPITAYKVWKGTTSGGESLLATIGNVTRYADANVVNGHQYYYTVQAVNGAGTSANSTEVSVKPSPELNPPTQVTGVQALDQKDGKLLVTWNPATDDRIVDHYDVTRDGVPIGSPTGSQLTDSGLANGKYYTYAVTAVDGSGNRGATSAPADGRATQSFMGAFVTGDPKNDQQYGANGAADITKLEANTDGTNLILGYTVRDLSALSSMTATLDYRYLFSLGTADFMALYEPTPAGSFTTCRVYVLAGGRGLSPQADASCSIVSGNTMVMTIPPTDVTPFKAGDTVSKISATVRNFIATTDTTTPSRTYDVAPDSGTATYVVGAAPGGQVPTFDDGLGAQSGTDRSPVTFTVHASHPTDVVTYTATSLPAGASVARDSGVFTWTPAVGQAGSYTVTFAASTGAASATETKTISITHVNHAPVLSPIGDKNVTAGNLLEFYVSATDPDNDPVTLSATGLPSGSAFDAATGRFSWLPSVAGTFSGITFSASDGQLTASQTMKIVVAPAPGAPVWNAIASTTLVEGAAKNVTVKATEATGAHVTLANGTLPAWATFRDNGDGTGTIALAPRYGDHGSYQLPLLATANGYTTSALANVTVLQATSLTLTSGSASTIASAPGHTVTLSATITNTGPEEDNFTLSATNSARWALSGVPLTVDLPPGASLVVTYAVTVPAHGTTSSTRLTATSLANPSVSKAIATTINVPVVASVTYASDPLTMSGGVSGTVRLTYVDGAPILGASIVLTQTPETFGPQFASKLSGHTDATGAWSFDFGTDLPARLPDQHAVLVKTSVDNVLASFASAYTVVPG